jgi:hypothetical protein
VRQGVFRHWWVYLFGERTERLRENTSGAHWLSYLLVTVQSAAVVLALGHSQIQLLFSPDPAVQAIAGMALFLLVATVWAADLCVLDTLRRVPVLFRNRQSWALAEHVLYMLFVLAVEGSTFALVLAVLDTDPRALVSDASILPPDGWAFGAQIGARAVLTVWTSVQLWIVRGKLPPQWSTLILEARELMGGQAQRIMRGLNLDSAALGDVFAAYAAMSRPPARVARWWNKGLVRREYAALVEEDRQRESVVRALSSFESPALPPFTAILPAPVTPYPTGGGSPSAAPVEESGADPSGPPARDRLSLVGGTPRRHGASSRKRPQRRGVRTVGTYEAEARAAWASGARSVTKMRAAVPGMSQSAAGGWVRTLKAEEQREQVAL